jgi:hypothetical protein
MFYFVRVVIVSDAVLEAAHLVANVNPHDEFRVSSLPKFVP